MSHLAAGTWTFLAIEMEIGIALAEDRIPIRTVTSPQLSQDIGHRGRAALFGATQRQIADCPELLFKLTAVKGLDRQMPRIVRSGSNFVDEQPAIRGDEEFDAEQPDDI